MNIITDVKRIANIPSLLFYEESSRKNPLVLIVHGFNNDKECSESSDIEFELEDEYHFVSNSMIDKAINWTVNKML